jgi:hypothetical protein
LSEIHLPRQWGLTLWTNLEGIALFTFKGHDCDAVGPEHCDYQHFVSILNQVEMGSEILGQIARLIGIRKSRLPFRTEVAQMP